MRATRVPVPTAGIHVDAPFVRRDVALLSLSEGVRLMVESGGEQAAAVEAETESAPACPASPCHLM